MLTLNEVVFSQPSDDDSVCHCAERLSSVAAAFAVSASVVAEDRDSAIYHIVCNISLALAHDPYPNRPFRKTDGQLCDNSPSDVPLRNSQPAFRQLGA